MRIAYNISECPSPAVNDLRVAATFSILISNPQFQTVFYRKVGIPSSMLISCSVSTFQ